MKQLLLAAAALCASAAAQASVYVEGAGDNDTLATAELVNGYFDRSFSPDIGDATVNTSTDIPHVTVRARAEAGGRDTFAFVVAVAGSRGIFDIDRGYADAPEEGDEFEGFDANLSLYDAVGTLLASYDDSDVTDGQGGSQSGLDSFFDYVFAETGTYYIQVGSCCTNQPFDTVPSGGATDYELQISLENADVPEPATLGLFTLGALALATSRRRRA